MLTQKKFLSAPQPLKMPNLTNENFKKTHNSAEELGRISNNIPGYAYFAHTANRRPMKHSYGKNTKKKCTLGS